MGSSPEKFFEAMDQAFIVVTEATVSQQNTALNQLLFEAMASAKAERQIIESQLELAQVQFPAKPGGQ